MSATASPSALPFPTEQMPRAALARVERLVVAALSLWFLAVLGLGWAGVFAALPRAASRCCQWRPSSRSTT